MKIGMKVGEKAYFDGVRIECARHETLLGKRRCAECAFEEMPMMCYLLRCSPTKATQVYYRVCKQRKRKKRGEPPTII